MIARHDRAVEPCIVRSAEKSLTNALRGSADGDHWPVGIEGDNSLSGGDIARQGPKSNSNCVESVLWIECSSE